MTNFTYLSKYNIYGVPDIVEEIQHIPNGTQDEININLPNGTTIVNNKPEWVRKSDISIADNCELSVTFISEGAGYKNGLGYYIYNSNEPPNRFSDINDIYIIFPNCSLPNKGGNLTSGTTVKIPYDITDTEIVSNKQFMTNANYIFPVGKSIGFVCFANCWKMNGSTQAFLKVNHKMYSTDPALNPESNKLLKHHSINFRSTYEPNRIIYGFEDLRRDHWSDDDFNDLLFSVNPTNMESIKPESYNDSTSQHYNGIILCEDILVNGDLDYNDLTLKYNITEEILSNNKLKSLSIKLQGLSRGAIYNHDFGIIIPNIKTKQKCKIIRETYITSTNTTNKQCITSEVVGSSTDKIILIKNTKDFLPPNAGFNFTNTLHDVNNNIQPSYVTIKVIFIENNGVKGISRNEFNTLTQPYRFYLDVYKNNNNNSDHSIYSNIDYETSGKLKSLGVLTKKKILVLENVDSFCIPKESVPLIKAYPKLINHMLYDNFINWHSMLFSNKSLVKNLINHIDTHVYSPSLSKDSYNNNIYFKDLGFSENIVDFTETNINDILVIDNLHLTDLVDWNDLTTIEIIDTIVNYIKEFGTCHITLNKHYNSGILFGKPRMYYVSISSLQTNTNRHIHATKSGTTEVLELMSWTDKYQYLPVFI